MRAPLIRKMLTAHFRGALVQKRGFGRRDITLYCVSIAKRLAEKTNKLLQGLIRGGAPRAPGAASRCRPALWVQHYILIAPQAAATSAMRRAMPGSMSGHFTCPLVALRFEGTFHVFAKVLAKTFHFCAAVYVRLSLTYICAKISRLQRHGILSLTLIAVPRRT